MPTAGPNNLPARRARLILPAGMEAPRIPSNPAARWGWAEGSGTLGHDADPLTREFGPGLYEDMMVDPAVVSAVNTLKLGILGSGIQLVPAATAGPESGFRAPDAKDQARIDKAAEVADFCRRALDNLPRPIEDVALELLDCCWCNVKLAEVVYEVPEFGPDRGKYTLKSITPKPKDAWLFVVDPAGQPVGYLAPQPLAVPGGEAGRPTESTAPASPRDTAGIPFLGAGALLPPQKCLVLSWSPKDGDPRGTSVLAPAWGPWNYKTLVLPWLFEYLGLFARPKGVASPGAETLSVPEYDAYGNPTGVMLSAYDALVREFSQYANKQFFVLPPGTIWNLIQATGNGEAYRAALDWYDRQILTAVLGTPAGTMEAQRNSMAQAEVGQDRVGLNVHQGRRTLAHALGELLYWLVAANEGEEVAQEFTPTVAVGGASQEDLSRLMTAAVAAGYQMSPDQFPYWDAKFGMPPRKTDPMAEAQEKKAMAAQALQPRPEPPAATDAKEPEA